MRARGDSPTASRVSPLVFQDVLWNIIHKRRSRFYLRPPGGFTLIELMLVVAIIGILSAIVVPRFGDMLRKARESATKGSLGAVRSALRIYYAEMEGISVQTPSGLSASGCPFLTKYINEFPSVRLGLPVNAGHQDTAVVLSFSTAAVDADGTGNPGGWFYNPAEAFGQLLIGCTHTDTKLAVISAW